MSVSSAAANHPLRGIREGLGGAREIRQLADPNGNAGRDPDY